MKILISFLFLFFQFTQAQANTRKSGPLGLGVIFGNPTALTGKYNSSSNLAYDFGLAFSMSDYFLAYGDYLVLKPNGFGNRSKFISQLIPYYGIGGVIAITNKERTSDDRVLSKRSGSLGVGLRIPFGVEWRPIDPEFGFFFEVVPGISLVPETTAMFQGGLGLRYYF